MNPNPIPSLKLLAQCTVASLNLVVDPEEIPAHLFRDISEDRSFFLTSSSPAMQAIKNQKHHLLHYLLFSKKTSASEQNSYLLRGAAMIGNTDVLPLLVKYGADVSALNNTALRTAASRGQYAVAAALVRLGANVHAEHNDALRYASRLGHKDIVEMLLQHGANPADSEYDAVGWASRIGRADMLRQLLAHSPDPPDVILTYTNLPLYWAARNDHIDCFRLLVEEGGLQGYGAYLLTVAAEHNSPKVARELVASHEVPMDTEEYKPIRTACHQGHIEVTRTFLELGCPVMGPTWAVIVGCAEYGHLTLLRVLVENGADIHVGFESALRKAAKFGHYEVARYLIEHGADVHARNDEVIRYAAQSGNTKLIDLFVEEGCDVHVEADDALLWACRRGDIPMALALLGHGADFTVEGFMPIHFAAKFGHLELLQQLLLFPYAHFESVPFTTIYPLGLIQTAREVAGNRGHYSIVRYLYDYESQHYATHQILLPHENSCEIRPSACLSPAPSSSSLPNHQGHLSSVNVTSPTLQHTAMAFTGAYSPSTPRRSRQPPTPATHLQEQRTLTANPTAEKEGEALLSPLPITISTSSLRHSLLTYEEYTDEEDDEEEVEGDDERDNAPYPVLHPVDESSDTVGLV